MRWLFFLFVLSHGLIHLVGFGKGFGLAELPQLTQPISRGMALAWLVAGLSLVVTAILFIRAPSVWWAAGLAAVVLSQIVIISSWSDARFGTLANAIILCAVVYGFATRGPLSFRSEYRSRVDARMAAPTSATRRLAEADLVPLPEPVRRYIRLSGAIDRPRVRWFRAKWRGRIRAAPNDPWMPRPELTRAETVTLLNDICVMAPGALCGARIEWEPVDDRTARARYTVGPNTVSATLHFDGTGDLRDFVSDDRLIASPDGRGLTPCRWSTPLAGYREFGPHRAASLGEGRWHPPSGPYAYVELELLDLRVCS